MSGGPVARSPWSWPKIRERLGGGRPGARRSGAERLRPLGFARGDRGLLIFILQDAGGNRHGSTLGQDLSGTDLIRDAIEETVDNVVLYSHPIRLRS